MVGLKERMRWRARQREIESSEWSKRQREKAHCRKKCNQAWESAGGDEEERSKPETQPESSPVTSAQKNGNSLLYGLWFF